MSNSKSGIQWTEQTWNPVTGCTKVSPGCIHCYAETMTKRFPNTFPNGFKITLHSDRLQQPLSWRKPRLIFVNSMSDLFHEDIPLDFIQTVFDVIRQTPHHIYQILTKRPERILALSQELTWYENIWLGVSVESQAYVHRITKLQEIGAKIKFLSCEPLLGNLRLDLQGIDWVIVGGESGTGYRELKKEWVETIYQQCIQAQVPFFFKQWGGITPKAKGRTFRGQEWNQMPELNASLTLFPNSDRNHK